MKLKYTLSILYGANNFPKLIIMKEKVKKFNQLFIYSLFLIAIPTHNEKIKKILLKINSKYILRINLENGKI